MRTKAPAAASALPVSGPSAQAKSPIAPTAPTNRPIYVTLAGRAGDFLTCSDELLSACWAAMRADARALDGLEGHDTGAWLGGPLAVDALAVAATATTLLAASELAHARGAARPSVGLSAEHAAL